MHLHRAALGAVLVVFLAGCDVQTVWVSEDEAYEVQIRTSEDRVRFLWHLTNTNETHPRDLVAEGFSCDVFDQQNWECEGQVWTSDPNQVQRFTMEGGHLSWLFLVGPPIEFEKERRLLLLGDTISL